MKKILLGITILFSFLQSAFALNITTHSSLQSNCDGGTFPPLVIYGNDTYHLWDYINTVQEGIIASNSDVSVYINSNKVNIPNGWVQVSNYMPSAGQFYTVWNNQLAGLNIPNLVPADRDTPVAQIVYRIKRMLTGTSNSFNFNGNYIFSNFTGNNPVQMNLGSLNKNFDPSTVTADNECISILPRWCGDSVLDSANGEQCDFNDATHTGWGVGGCDVSCQPIAGGGGGGGNCIAGSVTGVQGAPVTAATSGLCQTGSVVGSFTSVVVGTTTNYTWSCNGNVGGNCSASYTTGWGGGGGGGWGGGPGPGGGSPGGGGGPSGGSPITTPGSSSYCGNGVIERPNGSGQNEECDTPAPWCVNCMIASTNPGSNPPGTLTITNPGVYGPLDISQYKLIIGDNVPVFSNDNIIAFQTSTPMYLENKVATVTNNSPLISGSTVSKNITGGVGGTIYMNGVENKTFDGSGNLLTWTITYNPIHYPSSILLFNGSDLMTFHGDSAPFASNPSIAYRDTPVSSTPSTATGSFYASLQYLETSLSVRVSKSLVSNIAGGNAYITNPVGYDVNTVVSNFLGQLQSGNFTTTTVNTTSFGLGRTLSSATKSIAGDTIINAVISSGSTLDQNSIQNSTTFVPSNSANDKHIYSLTDLINKSERLGDTESVRVFKEGNISIDGTLNLSGVRTVIVENGNLTINADVLYADKDASLAFILKNGNLIVNHTVDAIAGVYVVLGGSILSDGTATPDRLSVDGSLYGNTSDLVEKRSYVRGEVGDSAINVGVVIDYSNRSLIHTPPFLSQFLEQYSMEKVAR